MRSFLVWALCFVTLPIQYAFLFVLVLFGYFDRIDADAWGRAYLEEWKKLAGDS